jgi:hypothetical protein
MPGTLQKHNHPVYLRRGAVAIEDGFFIIQGKDNRGSRYRFG